MPLRLHSDAGELSFISTVATFGTAVEVTASELSIESFFPADERTAEAVAHVRLATAAPATLQADARRAGPAGRARAAGPARAADPVDHTQPAAPDGTPVCAKWVHDRYTVERGGRQWPTWHPPRDPRYHCAFGHEHGSNPRAFRFFRRTGMPAFGPIGAYAGSDEPHARLQGVRGQRRPQGARLDGGAAPGLRLAAARHRSLPLARGLAVHARRAPAGGPYASDGRLRRRAAPTAPARELAPSMRLLPHPDCDSVYEEWDTALDVGGVLGANPGFAIDNAITQFDPAAPERIVFNKRFACGPQDPAGWDSYCKGDKRTVLPPALGGPQPRRGRASAPTPTAAARPPGFLQVVSRRMRIDQSRGVLRRRERVHHGAPQRRRHLPRRPRAQLDQLRVPGLLRDPRELAAPRQERHGADERQRRRSRTAARASSFGSPWATVTSHQPGSTKDITAPAKATALRVERAHPLVARAAHHLERVRAPAAEVHHGGEGEQHAARPGTPPRSPRRSRRPSWWRR